MKDGIFFMDIASYKSEFQVTHINEDTTGWNLDYFLMQNDPDEDS